MDRHSQKVMAHTSESLDVIKRRRLVRAYSLENPSTLHLVPQEPSIQRHSQVSVSRYVVLDQQFHHSRSTYQREVYCVEQTGKSRAMTPVNIVTRRANGDSAVPESSARTAYTPLVQTSQTASLQQMARAVENAKKANIIAIVALSIALLIVLVVTIDVVLGR